MSYVQRRRFLWIIFFAGLVLAAVVANATTLARLSFDDLAQQSMAIARLRCLGSETHWHGGEIWTETKFETVKRHKGELEPVVTIRMLGGPRWEFLFAGGWRANVPGRRRGLSISVGSRRRTVSRAGLVARHISHCSRCTNRPRARDAGIGLRRI